MKHIPVEFQDPELGTENADSYLELLDQFKILRKARGFTRGETARRMNTSDRVVSELERGISNPTIAQLERYAEAIGVYLGHFAIPKNQRDSWVVFSREITDRLDAGRSVDPAEIATDLEIDRHCKPQEKQGWTIHRESTKTSASGGRSGWQLKTYKTKNVGV
ncbi:helix-turn-helix transcriptional regulator [Staphylococcus chromogenes]|nr:helix-turn-helix transcriptional regulator [Staphylococcus chromogenes]